MRIGIDFGGVIVRLNRDGSIDPNDGNSIAQTGVFPAFEKIVDYTDGNTWIISKASPDIQKIVNHWLELTGFFKRTRLLPGHLIFCETRKEKTSICRNLDIDYFIDDNEEVLEYMIGIVPNLFLFGGDTMSKNISGLSGWNDACRILNIS